MTSRTRIFLMSWVTFLIALLIGLLLSRVNTTATEIGLYLSFILLSSSVVLIAMKNVTKNAFFKRCVNALTFLALAFSIFYIFNNFFFYNMKIFNDDMYPVIEYPKTIYVRLVGYEPTKDDVVFYRNEKSGFNASRLKGSPYDVLTFEYVNEKEVYLIINNKEVNNHEGEKYNLCNNEKLYQTLLENDNMYILKENEYLIISDNYDSINADKIILRKTIRGKVLGV